MQLRSRWTDGDSQHVLYQHLGLDFGDPDRDKVTGHLFARAFEDMGPRPRRDRPQPLADLVRVRDRRLDARLYSAYLDIHRADPAELIRLGRQETPEVPYFLAFDGMRIDARPIPSARRNVRVGLYGGIPVRFYATRAGDALAGAFVEVLPWRGGRLRLDGEYIRDHDGFFGNRSDTLLGIRAGQAITDYLRLDSGFTALNGRPRDFDAQALAYHPGFDFQVQLAYRDLLRAERSRVLEFEPFTSLLQSYFPYRQGSLRLSKGIANRFWIETGVEARELKDRDRRSAFNREFRRGYLTLSGRDVPGKDFDASVTGEAWGSPRRRIVSAGGELARRFGSRARVSVGTFYSLFKYDVVGLLEREHVRTFFGRVEFEARKGVKFDVRYEIERDRSRTFHGLRAGLRWTF